jgi:anaerobic selenocysteine-containing dehydrogenase
MHLLVRDNLLDRDFLSTSVQGFEELKEKILPDFTPERVSSLTGLSPEDLQFMARTFGKARAPFIRIGAGLSRSGNGGMNVRTITCLPALVGAWGKPGGGAFAGTSTAGAFTMAEITREDFAAKETRMVNMNRLGHALTRLDNPPIQSLYVYHSNPASIAPDQNQVLKGLTREDLFTVVHERFMTDTAKYADVVLPATSSLEQSDLYRAYGTYCIQKAEPAILPIGESKSNREVFSLLAQAMGFMELFFRQSAEGLIHHILSILTPMRKGIDEAAFISGKAVELPLPEGYKTQFKILQSSPCSCQTLLPEV